MGAIDGRGRIETYEEALAWIEDSAETAIIHIDAEALERDFAEFVREAWPIVDPSEYLHNWHIDAMCLPTRRPSSRAMAVVRSAKSCEETGVATSCVSTTCNRNLRGGRYRSSRKSWTPTS